MLKGKQVKDKNGLTIITESIRRERERSLIIRQNIHVYRNFKLNDREVMLKISAI